MRTWEMLRDIREGETYEVVSSVYDGPNVVALKNREGYTTKVLVWLNLNGEFDGEFIINGTTLEHEWRKRRKPIIAVDFPTAFAAYEMGALIKPVDWSSDQEGYEKSEESAYIFRAEEIRGKWIVEGDGDYWWE